MSNHNPRQRIKKASSRIDGNNNSLSFDTEEHSVFYDTGDIATKIKSTAPVIQGVVSQDSSKIIGQCQTCLNFATAQMYNTCWNCSKVVCSICAKIFEKNAVCPSCLQILKRRRWVLIAKKIFIDPFVERIK